MRLRIVFLFGLLTWQVAAAPSPAPQDLPAAIQLQVAARETLKTQAEDGQAALRKWYEASLDAIRTDAAGKANLDLVLATDGERARMDRELTAAETGALPKILRELRARYDQARLARVTQYKAALSASLREYMLTLDILEKSLTRKLDIDGAVAARKERAAAADEISALAAPAAAPAVASAGASPAAATPPGAPAPAAPPRATPPPVFATSLSASNSGTAPVLQVASELKAFGTIQNPMKDAIPFETPMGFGSTKGGRGVLILNDPGTGKRGSTWSTEWTGYYGTYIVFVHPYNGGYMIVRLLANHAEPVVVSEFQKQPMGAGGSPAIFKETPAAAEIYPLKPNRKYAVVSQLDAKGRYSLSVDGKVVQAGALSSRGEISLYSSTTPLILPAGFKGDNLPMKWKAGYASLMVGPVPESANAINLCENITFQGSAPLADKTR